jgi:CDP-glycerol glycerophosphotransferase
LGGGAAVDTQELLVCTDLLITDYSGCYFDYLLIDRPVIHFAYDREYYTKSDRGLYFDLDEAAAGPVVECFHSLCENIEQDLLRPERHHGRREKVRTRIMGFETGDACRKISSAVLGDGFSGQ